jgi:hypothetical protein
MKLLRIGILSLCLILMTCSLYSQAEWIKIGDSKEARFDKIKISEQENLFLTGTFKDSLKFGNNLITGEGTYYHPNFLSCFDKAGTNKWLVPLSRHIPRYTITPQQDIFVAAFIDPIYDNFNVDKLKGNINRPSFYVTKFDLNGTKKWFTEIMIEDGVTEAWDSDLAYYGTTVTHDKNGDCYALFRLANATRLYKLNGQTGAVISKTVYGAVNGTTQYTKALEDIKSDKEGNLYYMSGFKGNLVLPDTTILSTDNNTPQFYLAKYNPQGQRLWFFTAKGVCNSFKIANSQKYIYISGQLQGKYNQKTPELRLDGVGFYKLDIQNPQIVWLHSYAGSKIYPNETIGGGDFETDKDDNIYATSLLSGYFYIDSVGFETQIPEYGVIKIDSSGNMKPIVRLGTINRGFIKVAPIGNRVYVPLGLNAYNNEINFADSLYKINNDGREKPAIVSFLYPTDSYQLQIDSIKTSGECYKQPLKFYTKSSNFRQGNNFAYDISLIPQSYYHNIYGAFQPREFSGNPGGIIANQLIEGRKIDTFTRQLTYGLYRSDFSQPHETDEIRVCSSNPIKCSKSYKMGVPALAFIKDTICRGETTQLNVSGSVSYKWTPSTALNNATSATPSVNPSSSTTYQVESLTKLGCSTKNTVEILVVYGNTDSLRDTVKLLCNNPDENVRLNGTLSPQGHSDQLYYQWQPNNFISPVNAPIAFANPLQKTKYYLNIRDSVYHCTMRDSIFVDAEKCKILYGKAKAGNDIILYKKIGLNPELTLIKTKKVSDVGNYSFRTSDAKVYLQSITPADLQNFNGKKYHPTYYDKALVGQQAKEITLLPDSTKVDINQVTTDVLAYNYRVSGTVFDYYEPSRVIKDLKLVLVDTNYSKILRGESADSINAYFTKTDKDGRFIFETVTYRGTYNIWGDRFSLSTINTPKVTVDNRPNISNIVLYLKDNQLIACSGDNPDCSTISGTVFIKPINSGCNYNSSTDFPWVEGVIKITPGPIYVSAGFEGKYSVVVRNGNYNVTSLLPPYFNPICPPNFDAGYNVSLQNGVSVTDKNFVFTPMISIQDLGVNVGAPNPIRPGFETEVWVSVSNSGNTKSNTTLKLKYPPAMTYLSSSVPFTTNQNQELNWRISELKTNEQKVISVKFRVEPNVNLLNNTVVFYTEAFPEGVRDGNVVDNIDSTSRIVTGAYDPNDKQSKPIGPSKDGKILSSTEKFQFTIRFQNTGTDTAFNIVVRDTLEAEWNPLSIKTIATSHKYRMVMKEKNIIEWHFDNILLQDSFKNEPASHGFITFTLSPIVKPLSIGTQLTNKAAIFFDYNPPIITNTTRNQVVSTLTSLADLENNYRLKINPNLVQNTMNFTLEDDTFKEGELSIYDLSGRLMLLKSISNKIGVVDVSHLSAGEYICTVKSTENKVFVSKFLKV